MNFFRGLMLSLGSTCFIFFVCSIEALISEYFYIPILLLIFGIIFTVIGFSELVPKKRIDNKETEEEKFIRRLNSTKDFNDVYNSIRND